MDISELGFSAIKKIERMKENSIEDSKHSEVIYKSRKNTLYKALIADGYLVLDTVNTTKDYMDYDFYLGTDKLKSASIDKILMDLVGHDKDYILKNKVISITDVPWDFEDCIESLCSADGYFDKVDIGDGDFRKALDMHGFTTGAGVNGHYSCGTEKLSKFYKADEEYKVIEIITGKTKAENDEILKNDEKTTAIKTMKETANLYGYIVMTSDEYDDMLDDGKDY